MGALGVVEAQRAGEGFEDGRETPERSPRSSFA